MMPMTAMTAMILHLRWNEDHIPAMLVFIRQSSSWDTTLQTPARLETGTPEDNKSMKIHRVHNKVPGHGIPKLSPVLQYF